MVLGIHQRHAYGCNWMDALEARKAGPLETHQAFRNTGRLARVRSRRCGQDARCMVAAHCARGAGYPRVLDTVAAEGPRIECSAPALRRVPPASLGQFWDSPVVILRDIK